MSRAGVLSTAILAGHFCFGQPPTAANPYPMVTDRPDFTESSDVVRAGWVQVEGGFNKDLYGAGQPGDIAVGNLLFRIGLGHRLELRLANPGLLSEAPTHDTPRTFGGGDSEFAFKYKIVDETANRPAFGLIGVISAPTGAPGFSSNAWEPGVKLTWAKDLPAGFDLNGNVNWAYLAATGGRLHQVVVSASAGHDLPAGLAGFWEVYGFTEAERGEPNTYVFDTGVTRMIGRNAQWDASFARRLSGFGPDWSFGFGLSFRCPFSARAR